MHIADAVSSIEPLDRCLPILPAKRYGGRGIRPVLSTEWRSHYRLQIFPPGERRIPVVIRHSVKADSVDAVNHGAPDIKAITETSLMWFSRRAVVSPLISATACIDFCSVLREWKMASCRPVDIPLGEIPFAKLLLRSLQNSKPITRLEIQIDQSQRGFMYDCNPIWL